MPRPKDKEQLLFLSNDCFQKLLSLVNSFSNKNLQATFLFEIRDKNLRDVLMHLHHWHLMMLDWYKLGMSGVKPCMPAEGYTWKTTQDLNKKIWKQYQNTSYNDALKLLNESFLQIQELIKNHTDQELFEKKLYKWTGTTSLASYLISSSSSHYDWAIKIAKKHKKSLIS
ncbi:MAG: hypothetical protein COB02_07260 [Candidatus Cloacimonadota bacterium]|nr:MAG: hypothetical protein COB02_07260 [Candidatus Cloacimonadota bacterium]